MIRSVVWAALVALSNPLPLPMHHSGKFYQAPVINYWADIYLVPRWFGIALTKAESDFRPRLETWGWVGKGRHRRYMVLSHGLTETNPRFEREFAADVGLNTFDWHDPSQSARVGMGRASFLLERFDGDLILVAACYNAGIAKIQSALPIPKETLEYLRRVLG